MPPQPRSTFRSGQSRRPTVPGQRPGVAPIVVTGGAQADLTPRQIAREKAKIDQAVRGHAAMATAHRKTLADLEAKAAQPGQTSETVAALGAEAESLLQRAELHESIAADFVGAHRKMAAEVDERATAAGEDAHAHAALRAQAAALSAIADGHAKILKLSADLHRARA